MKVIIVGILDDVDTWTTMIKLESRGRTWTFVYENFKEFAL